jgi:predicted ester cyclase
MSAPDAVMREWFHEVWNERRPEAIDRLMAADARVHGLGNAPIVGPAAFKPFHKAFCDSFGDFTIDVVQSMVDGDRVAVLCHVTGRHQGDALGGKATGNAVDFHGMVIGRVQNGQIVEGWNCFDFLTMYQQLGWVKSPVV